MKPIEFILSTVAKAFDVEVSDILVRSRSEEAVEARQAVMYILWNSEGYTLTEIGRVLGGRSASTISQGYQSIARRLGTDERLRWIIEEVNMEIKEGGSIMDIIVCSQCGQGMARTEVVDGVEKDWSNDVPVCPVCRGVPGATPLVRNRDVLGGFPWKRDADGKKVRR